MASQELGGRKDMLQSEVLRNKVTPMPPDDPINNLVHTEMSLLLANPKG
jgi:hypothetical protein